MASSLQIEFLVKICFPLIINEAAHVFLVVLKLTQIIPDLLFFPIDELNIFS